jgi:hypothetical protein
MPTGHQNVRICRDEDTTRRQPELELDVLCSAHTPSERLSVEDRIGREDVD